MPASDQGPPVPEYIFRGHSVTIHALHFFQDNRFFASGDSDGWVVIWRLTTRRAAAAWKAHDGGVMCVNDWAGTRLITHGRDHKLRVWQMREADLDQLSKTLPIDTTGPDQPQQPWLLHSMDVNALNFCAFTMCPDPDGRVEASATDDFRPILVASPNGLDSGGVDIFQLPSEKRISKLPSDKASNTGMVMALRIFCNSQQNELTLVVGYEDGRVALYTRKDQNVGPGKEWERLILERPHRQPVLSLDVSPNHSLFFTSSADSMITKYAIPQQKLEQYGPEKTNDTKHAGQQDLKIRSDGRIFATAGWDKHVRVYSAKTLKELAVLQWHQAGCYAIAFATILREDGQGADSGELVEQNAMERMKQERDIKVHNTHWLAAGSKDGKISLWDIY